MKILNGLLTRATRWKLSAWLAPIDELAIYKQIPISELKSVSETLKKELADSTKTYAIRFCGPRSDRTKQSTYKADATHFSVYLKDRPIKAPVIKSPTPDQYPPATITYMGRTYHRVYS
jgi:hypothetical protein